MKQNKKHAARRWKVCLLAVLCLTMLAMPLTSCKVHVNDSKAARTVQSDLNEKLTTYRTDLLESEKAMATDEGIKQYLLDWADARGVNYNVDGYGNVIMSVDAGSGYEHSSTTVLLCPYDSTQFKHCVDPMAMALYAVKNSNETGKLLVIFTREESGRYIGAEHLSKGLFPDDAKVLVLDGGEDSAFCLSSAYGISFRFTQKIAYTQPSNTVAYKITMAGLGSTDYQVTDNNPILRLRSLLSNLKSSNIGYELASFDGGKDGILSADSATMTIVISQDREDKFISKMDSLTTRFNEDKAKVHPGATYTYEKVEVPEKVLTQESTERFINFVYTIPHGNYFRDPETNELIARNCITYAKTTETEVLIDSVGTSLNEEQIKSIEETEAAFCDLSDASYERTGTVPNWVESTDPDGTEFSQTLARCYKNYTGKTISYQSSLATSPAAYIKVLNPKCQIVTMTINRSVLKNCTGTLMEYLIRNLPSGL